MNHHDIGEDPLAQFSEMLEKRKQHRSLQKAGTRGYGSHEPAIFSSRAYIKRRIESLRRSIKRRASRLRSYLPKRGDQK